MPSLALSLPSAGLRWTLSSISTTHPTKVGNQPSKNKVSIPCWNLTPTKCFSDYQPSLAPISTSVGLSWTLSSVFQTHLNPQPQPQFWLSLSQLSLNLFILFSFFLILYLSLFYSNLFLFHFYFLLCFYLFLSFIFFSY